MISFKHPGGVPSLRQMTVGTDVRGAFSARGDLHFSRLVPAVQDRPNAYLVKLDRRTQILALDGMILREDEHFWGGIVPDDNPNEARSDRGQIFDASMYGLYRLAWMFTNERGVEQPEWKDCVSIGVQIDGGLSFRAFDELWFDDWEWVIPVGVGGYLARECGQWLYGEPNEADWRMLAVREDILCISW